ncbi:MAG: ABC transporter ATP-binding protein [Acidimicrobiales bacterium]
MSRANNDLQQIQNAVVLVPLTIANLATVLAVLVVLLTMDPIPTVLALGSLPAVNVLAKRFASRLQPTMTGVQQESAELSAVVEETVSGIRVVKGFAAEPTQAASLAVEADDLYDVSIEATRIRASLLAGARAVAERRAHPRARLRRSPGHRRQPRHRRARRVQRVRRLAGVAAAHARVDRGHGAACRGVRAARPRDPRHRAAHRRPAPPSSLRPPGPGGEVRFEGVSSHGPEDGVLDGFDLAIAAGQSVALVGRRHRASPRSRSSWRASTTSTRGGPLDGTDVRELSLRDLRQSVGIVFEDTFSSPTPSPRTSRSPCPTRPSRRSSGLHAWRERTSSSWGSSTGTGPRSASAGSACREASASGSPSPRAILADPRVLVLDDATSAVDSSKEHEIRDAPP